MEKHEYPNENNLKTLANDARDLIAATADVAGDKVADARKRLAAALDNGKEMLGRVREGVADQAKAADQVIRDNPYQAVLISFGVGALIGYLAARSCRREA
jgi:ElaB/YqjD/DUF883 family membrane-anchored ribosome-binding protein